ncbi:hypothetical protein E4U55_002791 [Claviceps digitariae]|nr:hypothetical protein E4U55_002791 [Claviceps digitariae]
MAQDPEKASPSLADSETVVDPSTSSRSFLSSSSSSSSSSFTDTDTYTDSSNNKAQHLEPTKANPPPRCGSSTASASRQPDFEVDFSDGDPENPLNWALWYRCWVIFCVSFATWVATLYSTSYTSSTPGLMAEFGASRTLVTLGMTTYLLGLAAGSLVVAPLSELYGRRRIYMVCLGLWAVLIVPCGLAQSLTTIIVVRFIGAFFGSVMLSNAPGTVVDVSNPDYLARSMSLFGLGPLNGPVTGPIIGGFIFQHLGWRWSNWIVLMMAGLAIALMFTVRETYAPKILQRKAARLRKEMDDSRYWCRYDQKVSTLRLLRANLSRPFVLFATEPILWFMNFWISVVYGILYLCFVAYPVVFSQHRGWSPSMSGLSFIGIGIGSVASILAEPLFRRIIYAQPKDPDTGKPYPEAQASIMAMGAVATAVGQLGFSWTCLPRSIHWAVPIAFGIPFGCGNTISFVYGSNYLAGAYGIYAASALAGNAVIRSIFGGTLPLAGPKMYALLTPQWAGTLLGLLEVAMIPIPFVFWRYGGRIRARSRTIRLLREEQERYDAKRIDGPDGKERRAARRVGDAADVGDKGDAGGIGGEKKA